MAAVDESGGPGSSAVFSKACAGVALGDITVEPVEAITNAERRGH